MEEIVFTTRTGFKLYMLADEFSMKKNMEMVSQIIVVMYKYGDPIVNIYNEFLTMPISKQYLALGWIFEDGEYIDTLNYSNN